VSAEKNLPERWLLLKNNRSGDSLTAICCRKRRDELMRKG
jgi:hypothetical protein